MPTFNFTNALTFTSGVNATVGVSFADNGVAFTFTIQNGDGSNFLQAGGGAIRGDIGSGLNTSLQDHFILDVTGPSQTTFSGPVSFSVTSLNGSWTVNGQALATGLNVLTGTHTQLEFAHQACVALQSFGITSLTATINCFVADTAIATPEGPRAVQDLRPGDTITTAEGGVSTVRWLGQQKVDVRLSHPAKVNPVRITAGALGGGLPERDLLISPDHAVEIDGMLINAGALVNGSTIYQEPKMPMDGFTYYHVETDAHELLLAEGVAAETFIDYAGRDSFENGGESTAHIPEMDLPRISSPRLVPAHIRARLAPAMAAE